MDKRIETLEGAVDDRRSSPRFQCDFPVRASIHAVIPFTEVAQLINLSMGGARVKLRNKIEKLTKAELEFYMPRSITEGYLGCDPIIAQSATSTPITDSYSYDIGFQFLEEPEGRHGIIMIISKYICRNFD